MHPPNSFISTSNPESQPDPGGASPQQSPWVTTAQTLAWTILGVVAVDVAINTLFAMPKDLQQQPNALQAYFEYGRSMEGKIRARVKNTPEESAPITTAGWLGDRSVYAGQPTEAKPGDSLLIATYGSSFSMRVGSQIRDNPALQTTVRTIGAPKAPLNWTYAAYQDDRGHHKAQAAVLTLTAFNVAEWSMGGQFNDLPTPFTSPLFSVENGQLERRDPVIFSFEQLSNALWEDPQLWEAYCQQLAQEDPYYNPILFRASWTDHSSLLRLLRRGFSLVINSEHRDLFYDPKTGFRSDSKTIQAVFAVLREFKQVALADGVIPVVYVVNNQGWGTDLFDLLEPILTQEQIPYVSSHTIAPPDDPRGFMADGHLTPEKDAEVGEAIVDLVRSQLPQSSSPLSSR